MYRVLQCFPLRAPPEHGCRLWIRDSLNPRLVFRQTSVRRVFEMSDPCGTKVASDVRSNECTIEREFGQEAGVRATPAQRSASWPTGTEHTPAGGAVLPRPRPAR